MRRVLVTYNVKPGTEKDFINELENSPAVENVRKERGCHEYNYYIPTHETGKAILIELWENEECHKEHLAGPNMAPIGEIKAKYVSNQSAEILDT